MVSTRISRAEILVHLRGALDHPSLPAERKPLAATDWMALNPKEKCAILQLHNWDEDRTLREAFPRHAEYSRNRIEHLISVLDC